LLAVVAVVQGKAVLLVAVLEQGVYLLVQRL
jgi:hypothetical protein